MFLLWFMACGYAVEDWWSDLADAHCTCDQAGNYYDCVDTWDQNYQELDYYDACVDEPAPVNRAEMNGWVRDYTENCITPDEPAPQPDDPEWYLSCP